MKAKFCSGLVPSKQRLSLAGLWFSLASEVLSTAFCPERAALFGEDILLIHRPPGEGAQESPGHPGDVSHPGVLSARTTTPSP